MASLRCVELYGPIGLQVDGFGVIRREEKKGGIKRNCMPRIRQGKMWKIMGMYLGLVCAYPIRSAYAAQG